MAFEFKLPDIGEGVVEGEIVSWKVAVGDRIALDQPLVEVMTDKATVEIPSPRAGIVQKLGFREGDICPVGAVLVVIDDATTGAGAGAASGAPPPGAPASGEAAAGVPTGVHAASPTLPLPPPARSTERPAKSAERPASGAAAVAAPASGAASGAPGERGR
ncbi:MAG TPA: biotin/lipoyl-containing protein, partial [Haliangium sp.]|nr:biotin/lipoyl-containing protein [Haliangium sp.]